ncbi:MAG: nucleoside monophosphate kinase [Euryarchaeota archaeon]|nr:nucleoside monophosphate kinase [Euryarchaeota archaeon]
MIVAIGGPPGSGKTTAAELFAQTYGYVLISGGHLFREMAAERGMDLVTFSAYAEKHHDVDRQLDEMVLAAVREAVLAGKDVVVDGRIQAHLLARGGVMPFSVLIIAPLDVRAKRIADRERKTEKQALDEILAREASERARYQAIYGIDLDDLSVYALEIDSFEMRPEAIVRRIHEEARSWAAA